MKGEGTRFSDAEKEVFTEAYWSKYEKKVDRFQSSMTQIDPPNLLGPETSTTTKVSGKTGTPGPGTLQLTDEKGNSYFVDVDASGNYSGTVPLGNFTPTKMTLRTGTIKAAWERGSDGKTWTQVSGVTTGNAAPTTAPTQGAMAPRAGTQQQLLAQAAAIIDPCERALLVASSEPAHSPAIGGHASPPSALLRVRFPGGNAFNPRAAPSDLRLVGDPLPPEVVDQMNKIGKDIADYEHQKETLEKELRENKDAKTGKRLDRDESKRKQTELDNVKNKLKSAEQNKQFISDDARKVAEDAYKARKAQYALPEQIRQLRAKGDPASLQQADMMERQLQALNQFYGPIALAPIIVPAGQSGYARANTAASLASGNTPQVVKGHTTQVATADIRRQQETGIELDPLVHLEENERNETVSFPGYFGYNLSTQSWDKPDFSLAAIWTGSDPNPPVVASIASDDTFTIKNTYGLKACVKLNVAYGYDHVSTAIDSTNLAGDYHVTFNRNPTWIAGFKTGVNIDQFQQDYMQGGTVNHSQYTWTHWHTPFPDVPMISSGQISDDGYNHLSWESPHKNFMVYGELSPGTNPLPVPGLTSADWPTGAVNPLPVLVLTGTWIKE
ncbi:MAG: hypothetical protein NW202_07535 [Nitrospira sp.]|nr:hypothetical protein [Nitrospira sp.]